MGLPRLMNLVRTMLPQTVKIFPSLVHLHTFGPCTILIDVDNLLMVRNRSALESTLRSLWQGGHTVILFADRAETFELVNKQILPLFKSNKNKKLPTGTSAVPSTFSAVDPNSANADSNMLTTLQRLTFQNPSTNFVILSSDSDLLCGILCGVCPRNVILGFPNAAHDNDRSVALMECSEVLDGLGGWYNVPTFVFLAILLLGCNQFPGLLTSSSNDVSVVRNFQRIWSKYGGRPCITFSQSGYTLDVFHLTRILMEVAPSCSEASDASVDSQGYLTYSIHLLHYYVTGGVSPSNSGCSRPTAVPSVAQLRSVIQKGNTFAVTKLWPTETPRIGGKDIGDATLSSIQGGIQTLGDLHRTWESFRDKATPFILQTETQQSFNFSSQSVTNQVVTQKEKLALEDAVLKACGLKATALDSTPPTRKSKRERQETEKE
eukprot:PhF_6_TR15670/c0_g1_i1/m.24361